MDRLYVCVGLLAVLCGTVLSQDNENFPDEWEAEDMPNPWRSPQHCHLLKQGYICDPDRIMSDREMDLLNWLVAGFYVNDTVCPCSQYWCEMGRKGSHLSVAVVRKLKLADTFQDPERAVLQAVSNFALKLQNSVWNFGDCDNNIVMVFSRDDGVTFISYGKTIGNYMNSGTVHNIQGRFKHLFAPRGDHLTGFIEIILALRQTLNGNQMYNPQGPHYEQLIGGATYAQSSGVLATIALATVTTHWLF